MRIEKHRLVLGLAISPLVVPLLHFSGEYFISGYTEQGPGHVEKLFEMTLVFTYLSYIFSLLFGTPLAPRSTRSSRRRKPTPTMG